MRKLLLLTSACILLTTCAKNPVTGKKELMLMSESQEIALGQEADPSIVAEYGLYDNPVLQNFITTKGKEMAAISHEVSCPFSLKLLIHLWSMPLHCREGMSISQEA